MGRTTAKLKSKTVRVPREDLEQLLSTLSLIPVDDLFAGKLWIPPPAHLTLFEELRQKFEAYR